MYFIIKFSYISTIYPWLLLYFNHLFELYLYFNYLSMTFMTLAIFQTLITLS